MRIAYYPFNSKLRITIVSGPAASGKTYYVNKHAKADRYTLTVDTFLDMPSRVIEEGRGKDLIIDGVTRSSVRGVVNTLLSVGPAFDNVFITTQNHVAGYELWRGLKDTHKVYIVTMGLNKMQSFTEAAKPLMQWLAENEHPHVKAIVSADRAELLEEKLVIVL